MGKRPENRRQSTDQALNRPRSIVYQSPTPSPRRHSSPTSPRHTSRQTAHENINPGPQQLSPARYRKVSRANDVRTPRHATPCHSDHGNFRLTARQKQLNELNENSHDRNGVAFAHRWPCSWRATVHISPRTYTPRTLPQPGQFPSPRRTLPPADC